MKIKSLFFLFVLLAWTSAQANDLPRAEYPRPQMERQDWVNLNGEWTYNNFVGNRWNAVSSEERKLYLKNAYRVLLTRARQGMAIFVPRGSEDDATRPPEFYDGIYNYLKNIGIEEI